MLAGEENGETFYLSNASITPLSIWLEPWAQEFELPSRAVLTLVCTAQEGAVSPCPLIEIVDDIVTVWGAGGSRIAVFVNGVDQQSFTADYTAPDLGPLSTKGFVNLVFGDQPSAQPGGHIFPETKVAQGIVQKTQTALRRLLSR